jgi:DNA-binding transcriptional MocR family regulator
MSYKWDLSHLDRQAASSITQQLADHVARLIDAGELAPGEKLPPTRELAAAAGINHLTAARVYRKLAETGYVTAAVGRGTFVRTAPPPSAAAAAAAAGDDDEWQSAVLPERPSSWAASAALEASFRFADDPGVISIAAGFPAPELVPASELAVIAGQVFAECGPAALAYISAEGVPALREELAARGQRSGFATSAEEIIVTSGARQGLELAARALLRPGDVAVIESPSFIGMLVSLQDTGARVLGVPVDEDGFDVDALERILARHEVKVVALQTACHNPTGRDTSPERLERLAALARERSFFIVEDGVYATLRYEGEDRPRLRSAAPGHVVYVDSLSKTVGGGLRLGWLAAQGPVLGRLAALKTNSDMGTSTLVQEMALRYLRGGAHEDLMGRVTSEYRRRRDATCEALEKHLGDELTFDVPVGGHHVWATFQRPLDERTLYLEAVRAGVTYTPGSATTVEPPARTSLRLSFGLCTPEQLDEAIRRLATAVRSARRLERRLASFPVS